MDEKQLEFLNSIESIDWTSVGQQKKQDSKDSSKLLSSLSKNQRKRARKKAKKQTDGGVNSCLLKNVETVVFQNPDSSSAGGGFGRKRKDKSQEDGEVGVDIDLKKARFEVMKFSMNSLTGTEKYDAETALAISLGARKEKNKCVNYKELIAARKEEKRKEEEELALKVKSKPKIDKKAEKKKKQPKTSSSNSAIVRVRNVNPVTKSREKRRKR